MAKSLHEATKGLDIESLLWTGEQEKAFNNIKQALTRVPALGIPSLKKPFILYVAEKQGTALGVLIQKLRAVPRPVGYFSKQLDSMAQGWPGCLCAVAALLVEEASRLTFGQPLQVQTPIKYRGLWRLRPPLANWRPPY